MPSYAQMIHMIKCSEMFTKSSTFQKTILIYCSQKVGDILDIENYSTYKKQWHTSETACFD